MGTDSWKSHRPRRNWEQWTSNRPDQKQENEIKANPDEIKQDLLIIESPTLCGNRTYLWIMDPESDNAQRRLWGTRAPALMTEQQDSGPVSCHSFSYSTKWKGRGIRQIHFYYFLGLISNLIYVNYFLKIK